MSEKSNKRHRRLAHKVIRAHAVDTLKALATIFASATFWNRCKIAWAIVFRSEGAIKDKMLEEMRRYKSD